MGITIHGVRYTVYNEQELIALLAWLSLPKAS